MLSLAEQLLFFYPLKRHCNMPDFRVRIFKYVELSSSLLNGNQKKTILCAKGIYVSSPRSISATMVLQEPNAF